MVEVSFTCGCIGLRTLAYRCIACERRRIDVDQEVIPCDISQLFCAHSHGPLDAFKSILGQRYIHDQAAPETIMRAILMIGLLAFVASPAFYDLSTPKPKE
jgi:hypothetical protein